MDRPRVLAIILAGGKGERLYPLTRERGKPAVPFGGKYRIVDFVLSNFVNSGIYALYVLVQYKAQSLIEHLRNAWRLGGLPDHFVIVVPPQMRWGESWYQGTADAVYQNLNLIRDFSPDIVAIFGADHVYRMDIAQMIAFHRDRGADVTVAALPVPLAQAGAFGVVAAEADGRITHFEEKPASPTPMPGDPTRAYASMGNYLFQRDVLVEALVEDARRSTDHDFGRTIIPELAQQRRVFAYNFLENIVPGVQPYEERGYWRDVGTVEAYWQAHMDLLGPTPALNLDNGRWPILTAPYPGPSARILEGEARDALIGEGSLIAGGVVRRSILGRGVRVMRGAVVEESVVMDRTVVGEEAVLRRVIVDRFNVVPPGTRIGEDREADRLRYHVDPSGLVVLPRGQTR
ncbi:MAG: glucose-1-phosphate adenylyltransferase [Armatimonadota bacterium]|nr:glucose-1-phosphate adenylyltransferase [Armatimonadota bacterium]MDR7451106.1 glucose-1-phosphate adenylyltransferase [Armatimonadota bacterium]MDR7467289.1 glucose-1-phosphate adenylyltransferase [Armatimonadota bacterium]MDR7494550.1 glucose-1-phosphate adenylyltransferase [Armatimonadota bacterium]MDR7499873.1 glucose-1-phosphate adenylyltransferase [Armatimonadota bacterium]